MARCRTCWSDRPAPSGCPTCNPQQLESQLRDVRQRLYDVEAGNRALRDDVIGDSRRSSNMRDAIQELEAQLKEARGSIEYLETQTAELNAARLEALRELSEAASERERLAESCDIKADTIENIEREVERLKSIALDVRPSVRRFALAMERELKKNDHKGATGWLYSTYTDLLSRVDDEVAELKAAVGAVKAKGVDDDATNALEHVVKEAADVANFGMMIVDLACQGDRE